MKQSEILAEFQLVASRKIAIATEQSYRVWITKFLRFLDTPEARKIESSERKVEVFLSGMAREDYSKVSQNQCFNAVIFLYRHVFKKPLADTVLG
jgi:site-specific recombinase XerD